MSDPVELARSIQTLQYGEWTDVIDGNLFVACGQCGSSSHYLFRFTGPDMLRVRIEYDNELTQASREYNDHPLYKEVLALREQNRELTRQRETVLAWIRAHGYPHHSDSEIEEMLK